LFGLLLDAAISLSMAAEGEIVIVRFTYTGAEGEVIPDEATHITVAEDCTFVHEQAFERHPNIIEVVCHLHVEKIGERAFYECYSLRRVIMPGVKEVEYAAFSECKALTDVECIMLEIIGESVFWGCRSLRSISLPSARILERDSFINCQALADVKFGKNLERIEQSTFIQCISLKRIAIPLKNGLFIEDGVIERPNRSIFIGCENLNQVHLVDGAELHNTVAKLQLEEWRKDMDREIQSISTNIRRARPGRYYYTADHILADIDPGQKAQVIRAWIRSVLSKIIHYKAEHRRVLVDAAATLQLVLPQDIVLDSVLPFLQLPSHTFDGEEDYVVEGEDRRDDEEDDRVESVSNCCCCCIQ
jgi:hypothetical protein